MPIEAKTTATYQENSYSIGDTIYCAREIGVGEAVEDVYVIEAILDDGSKDGHITLCLTKTDVSDNHVNAHVIIGSTHDGKLAFGAVLVGQYVLQSSEFKRPFEGVYYSLLEHQPLVDYYSHHLAIQEKLLEHYRDEDPTCVSLKHIETYFNSLKEKLEAVIELRKESEKA